VRRCIKPILHPSEQETLSKPWYFAQAMLPSPFRLRTCAEHYLKTKRQSNAVPNASGCIYKDVLCVVVVSSSFTRQATFDRGRCGAVAF
jgi:hypothetical protein